MVEPTLRVNTGTRQAFITVPAGWRVEVYTIPESLQSIRDGLIDTSESFIGAIKQVRALLDIGLREAKDIVDVWREELRGKGFDR